MAEMVVLRLGNPVKSLMNPGRAKPVLSLPVSTCDPKHPAGPLPLYGARQFGFVIS